MKKFEINKLKELHNELRTEIESLTEIHTSEYKRIDNILNKIDKILNKSHTEFTDDDFDDDYLDDD